MDREPMTPEGHQKLLEEIEHIKSVERPRNIKAIEEARGHGDLSENADYDAAKNEQGMIAARLAICEDRLARAEIIDPKSLSGDVVMFGATVLLEDLETEEQITYQLVGTSEADPKHGRISIESPIGKAVIGKTVGDEVNVQTPNGRRVFGIHRVTFK